MHFVPPADNAHKIHTSDTIATSGVLVVSTFCCMPHNNKSQIVYYLVTTALLLNDLYVNCNSCRLPIEKLPC